MISDRGKHVRDLDGGLGVSQPRRVDGVLVHGDAVPDGWFGVLDVDKVRLYDVEEKWSVSSTSG